MTKKQENAVTGRPKSYDNDLLRKAVKELLANGTSSQDINEKNTKLILCEKYGVANSINTSSLARHVEGMLQELAVEEKRELLAALPTGTVSAVGDVLAGMQEAFLLMIARQNTLCQQNAEDECKELRQDKVNANWRIAELEGKTEDFETVIANLELTQQGKDAEIIAANMEIATLKADLDLRVRETSSLDRLVQELRDPSIRNDLRSALSEILAQPELSASIS